MWTPNGTMPQATSRAEILPSSFVVRLTKSPMPRANGLILLMCRRRGGKNGDKRRWAIDA
jgi:hypothetical protein